jgi:UDP-glucose 4-epimerase
MAEHLAWVIGAGGLLGSAVRSAFEKESWVPSSVQKFSWDDYQILETEFQVAVSEFVSNISIFDWTILWCAGTGTIGASEQQLKNETKNLSLFLDTLSQAIENKPTGKGLLFLGSSAGGVYAGAKSMPATELTTPFPISPYGHTKLEQELLVQEFAQTMNREVLIGRISNLYGPAQNVNKAQGLISQMCLSILQHRLCTIFVPLETSRDYLFATDAGGMIYRCCNSLHKESSSQLARVTIKIFASEQSSTISQLIGECRRLTKKQFRISLAHTSQTALQPREISFRSLVKKDQQNEYHTPISIGINAVLYGLLQQIQNGDIVSHK